MDALSDFGVGFIRGPVVVGGDGAVKLVGWGFGSGETPGGPGGVGCLSIAWVSAPRS